MRPAARHVRLAAAALACGAGWLLVFALDDPRLRFVPFVLGWGAATAGGLALAQLGPRGRGLALCVGAGLLVRALALAHPPAFSEDVFRYVYEGRLTLWAGPEFPFRHPPAAGPELGVPLALLDESWRRINHPELATVYPPLAQALFALGAALGDLLGGAHLFAVRALLVTADLATWRVLHRRSASAGLTWGLSPLVVLETAREGHVDVVSAAGLAIAALAFAARPRAGYAGLLVAALTKLNGLVLAPLAIRLERRGAWLLVPGLALLAAPYLWAAGAETSGLAAYATRWRAGDGAFSLLLAGSEALIGGDWTHLPSLGLTLTRHQLARGLAGLVFGAAYALLLARPARAPSAFAERAGLVLLLVLLLSPTLHPWYVLWLVPFAALGPFPGRWASLWLMGAAALLHAPAHLELVEGAWREIPALRALVHVPAWALLGVELRRPRAGSGLEP